MSEYNQYPSRYPLLTPMEAGYLLVVAAREASGGCTGATWGRKNIRASLTRQGLLAYSGDKQMIGRGGNEYLGRTLDLTDLGKAWARWFAEGWLKGEPNPGHTPSPYEIQNILGEWPKAVAPKGDG